MHWTDFIEVPKEDIIALGEYNCKGVKTATDGITLSNSCQLQGTYRSGCVVPTGQVINWTAASPSGGGRLNGDCGCSVCDCRTYIFKGLDTSDVINYVIDLGIV